MSNDPQAPSADRAHDLVFYLNGERVEIRDPDPSVLLLDYLRSSDVGLTGSKKGCGQGGCGLCTVMLSRWDEARQDVVHASINSCMHPIAALDGMAITTIEGTGSTDTEVSPVQWEIARQNGSQCGYCTPGWVMTMHSALVRRNGEPMTQEEIEAQFDGNLCRCTGYRPILYAMKHFASDWGPKDEIGCMQCKVDPAEAPAHSDSIEVDFPGALEKAPRPVTYARDGCCWYRPADLDGVYALLGEHRDVDNVKLVVGNTSIGVYDRYVENPRVLIDISQVPELRQRQVDDGILSVGAAITYTELLDLLDELLPMVTEDARAVLGAVRYMAHRTAGHIVRNAASLAGNTMLVVRHVYQGTPFPSDLFTALTLAGASLRVGAGAWGEEREIPILDFARQWGQDPELQEAVILGYRIPMGEPGELARTYKVAIRGENAHSIVNAGLRVAFGDEGRVSRATVVYGGIGPLAFHCLETEDYLVGRAWDQETLSGALGLITEEVQEAMEETAERMASVPYEGFSDEYRLHLAQGFFYQFFVHVAEQVAPGEVAPAVRSAGARYERPVTRGTQRYETYENEYPVNEPYIKLSAFLQSTGEAVYTHDIPLPRRGLQAALVTSARAHALAHYRIPGQDGTYQRTDTDGLIAHLEEKYAGFEGYITCRDILAVGGKVLQGGGSDEPLLCPIEEVVECYPTGVVQWQGQQIGIVLAQDELLAQEIAHTIAHDLVEYKDLDDPILTIDEALERHSIFPDRPPWPVHIWKIRRSGSELDWVDTPDGGEAEVEGIDCRVFHNHHQNGGQIHFYMETQSALAERGENKNLLVWSSTQSPDSVTGALVDTLGLAENRIDVRVKHVGGGYGGKTTRSPFTAAWAGLAAWVSQRPVRLALAREVDTSVVGRRHPLKALHQVAIATGEDDPDMKGALIGVDANYWFDGGATYDCSFTVMDCLQLRSDTAYLVPNYRSSGEVCRTNKTSNTAYRAFGMIQSMVAYEDSIERAAHGIGMLAEDVREKNLYRIGDATPYGQRLEYCYMEEVWDYAREESDFDIRLEAVEAFNRCNKWRKRGISLMPVKYGSGYNLASLEQGGALIEVFDDGTIFVRHGGVEMGQGVMTKVAQIAAQALNVPLCRIQMGEVDTQVIPNPTSTGASTGTALNGGAVKKAAELLRLRLENFCLALLRENGPEWCRQKGVNFWDYQDGWRHGGSNDADCACPVWDSIVGQAHTARVNLSSQVRYSQHGGKEEDEWGKAGGLEFHPGAYEEVDHFVGFTYSAGCSEVEVDLLTGEVTILRSDVYYDMGKSLNPAIDVGQVEGAFIQGVGYVLTEELIWQPDGPNRGNFYTVNTWQYKPPATSTLPLQLNVDLYPRSDAEDVPDNPNDLVGAKEVGEPPLVLATTVYLAVKRAILASREERGIEGWFELEAPATVQRIREAAAIEPEQLRLE